MGRAGPVGNFLGNRQRLRPVQSAMPRHQVAITHPERVYFPSGFTKADMIRYYSAVSPWMLPHLKNRPVTLIRFPTGVKGERFYEKNAPSHAPDWIPIKEVPRRRHEGHVRYMLINQVETLAWCANLGAIEFHPFLHAARNLDRPTHLAFDLDPGEGANLLACIEVAHLLREIFEKLGLESYPKVTGSKGLQLYIPLNTPVSYEVTSPFAKTVAEMLAQKHPKLVVSDMKKVMRKKRVLIDWSQNSQSKTTVCAYSLRGKHDEPFVSTPVTWDELDRAARKRDKEALFFGPDDALARAKKHGDLFAPVLKQKQKLPAGFMKLMPKAAAGDEAEAEAGIGRDADAETDATAEPKGSLKRYAAKRDFTRTAEPAGKVEKAPAGKVRRFVIQKHAASHLHFDFRLEMGGTLKSWAVPKGLPYELGVKRSAFEVEDHPLDYISFEGTIPKGQYGGGTVMVWDIGTYELLGGDFGRGDLKLLLHGKKLKGEWHIFRIRTENDKPVWLIGKSKVAMKPLSARQEDSSVLTRRSMARIAKDDDTEWGKKGAVKKGKRAKRKAAG